MGVKGLATSNLKLSLTNTHSLSVKLEDSPDRPQAPKSSSHGQITLQKPLRALQTLFLFIKRRLAVKYFDRRMRTRENDV